jgi:hypothetical protein
MLTPHVTETNMQRLSLRIATANQRGNLDPILDPNAGTVHGTGDTINGHDDRRPLPPIHIETHPGPATQPYLEPKRPARTPRRTRRAATILTDALKPTRGWLR